MNTEVIQNTQHLKTQNKQTNKQTNAEDTTIRHALEQLGLARKAVCRIIETSQ